MISIHRREYATFPETRTIEPSELAAYKEQGWVEQSQPFPDLAGPDIEVLELRQKDARDALTAAQKAVDAKEADLLACGAAIRKAKQLIAREKEVLAGLQRAQWEKDVIAKCEEIFNSAGEPVTGRMLMAAAENPAQERMIRELYLRTQYLVGKDDLGDSLFMLEPEAYLREQQEKARAEEEAKEAAIRARMTEEN